MSLDGVGYWLDLVSSAVLRVVHLKFKLIFSRWEKPGGARLSRTHAHTHTHRRAPRPTCLHTAHTGQTEEVDGGRDGVSPTEGQGSGGGAQTHQRPKKEDGGAEAGEGHPGDQAAGQVTP